MFGYPKLLKGRPYVLGLVLGLQACGDGAQFGGGSGSKSGAANVTRSGQPGDANGTPGATPGPGTGGRGTRSSDDSDGGAEIMGQKAVSSLTWLWQCQNAPQPVPKPQSDQDVIIEGKGPFKFDPEALKNTKLTFSGRLCPPDAMPRDIVFVLDTSISMDDNDPLNGTSCGRLNAVQSVLTTIPKGAAKYGLATFSSNLGVSSTMLYDDGQAMLTALAPGGNLSDVLCASDGTTNYNAGMARASELLSTGRPNAGKELYFISDGQPNAGEDGVAIATTLKSPGVNVGGKTIPVTIGTVMLAGQDSVLEQSIASKDAQGKALHVFAPQAQNLAKALTDLSANRIVSAQFKYRVTGDQDYTVLNVMDHLKGLDFSLPPMAVPVRQGGIPGIEVIYEYTDKLGQRFTSTGQIVLKVTGSP